MEDELKIRQLIREILDMDYSSLLCEGSLTEDDLWEMMSDLKGEILSDFKRRKTNGYNKIPWQVIPFPILQRVWEKYMELGFVPENLYGALQKIEDIIIKNLLKVNIITEFMGHTSSDPEEDFKEYEIYEDVEYEVYPKIYDKKEQLTENGKIIAGTKVRNVERNDVYDSEESFTTREDALKWIIKDIKKVLKKFKGCHLNLYDVPELKNEKFDTIDYRDDFYDWAEMENGEQLFSDYGLNSWGNQPKLNELMFKLVKVDAPEEKITIMDQMLNIIHARGDIASWFVDGGTSSLNKLSGNIEDMKPAEQLNEGKKYILLTEKRKSKFKVLKNNKIPLTDEERKEVFDKDAVWHMNAGKNKTKDTSAVWKSKNPKTGKITYVCNSHRAYNSTPTLRGAIGRFHDFIKGTS